MMCCKCGCRTEWEFTTICFDCETNDHESEHWIFLEQELSQYIVKEEMNHDEVGNDW